MRDRGRTALGVDDLVTTGDGSGSLEVFVIGRVEAAEVVEDGSGGAGERDHFATRLEGAVEGYI
jgi:hypothetical protein